jgi:serine/threonine protein kinase
MAADLKSGSMLGRYELLVRLGRGGMASVWVAREVATDGTQRLVAVKAMLPELLRRSNFRAMFLEEGQLVRSIDHPNVVKVHEVSDAAGSLHMAMEWVEGDSLRTIIKEARRRRPIPSVMAVKIIADAAAGLHAAHELRGWDGELRHLVHCDVSPHNILVGLDGCAKLVDFGVASATAHSDVGSEDRIKGKFGYMSPEQARAEKLDRRSDVFSLGIVLFELLTGERLFRGENAAHSLELVKQGPIPNPVQLNPKLSPKLVSIVQRALERDLSKRFQTAAQLGEALERYLVEERVLVSHASVGHLVRRVLGSRIEQQRQALREALTVSDGVVAAGLVPDLPTSSEHSQPHFGASGHFGVRPSDPPSSSSSTSTPRPQSIELAPRRRAVASVLPLLATITGLSAAAGAIWFVNNQPPAAAPVQHRSGATRSQQDSKPAPGAYWQDPGPWGVKVDSIPLDSAAADASHFHAPHPSKPAETSVHAAKPAQPDKPDKPDKAPEERPKPAQVELQDDVPAAVPPPTKSEPVSTVKPPPVNERTPLNRASAFAALSNAASSVGACRREGGPSGAGSASVTFSPDGPVSSVSLGAPFAGTAVGACVQNAFRSAHVPAFSGSAVTLSKSFRIPE